jgi:ElaA protein
VKLSAVPLASLDPLTAYSLMKLRQDVFVVEQRCAYPDLDGRDLEPTARQVVVEDDAGVVVGCARVLDDLDQDGPVWRIGRVALHPTLRGQGWSKRLMDAALEVCPDRPVVLDAQAPLEGFYASFGFAVVGPEYVEDGIPHVPMRRERG